MREKLLNSLYFILMWLAYIVMQLFQGKIRNINDVITLLVPLLLGWIIAVILLFIVDKAKFNFIKSIILSLLLICVDQVAKILAEFYVKATTINMLGGIVRIRIARNTYNSAMLNFFDIHIQSKLIIGLKIILLIVLILIIRKLYVRYKSSEYLTLLSILLISGILSSIIDNIAWGYSLDYINIPKYCIIDLKDIYIDFGIGSLLLYFSKIYDNHKINQSQNNSQNRSKT